MRDARIEAKAYAVILNAERTHQVVWRGQDQTKIPSEFHRLLGGHIEAGEYSVDAVVREINEELGATYVAPHLLGVLENVFTYQDQPGHEIVFVYAGALAEPDVVPSDGGTFYDNGEPIRVEWRPLDDGDAERPLYPLGVAKLISSWVANLSPTGAP